MANRPGGYFGRRSEPRLSPEQEAYVKAMVPKISRSQAESQTRPQVQRIYKNWKMLKSIVERHEATIQARWAKKSKVKRRAILLQSWPGMAADHRPDHVAFQKRQHGQSPRGIQYPVSDGPHHDVFMMPYINQQDLCRTEPLLLMMNSRGRNPPGRFAHKDLAASKFGLQTGSIQVPLLLDGHVMNLPVTEVPDGYGELAAHDWQRFPTLPNLSPQQVPGLGLWLLSIQDRLYDFLVNVAQAVLHDMPVGALLKHPVVEEPPSIAANSRAAKTTGIVTLSNRNLEAPYILPVSLDLERMKSLAAVRCSEAEDVVSALHEDPGYFSISLKEAFQHQPHAFKAQHDGNVVPIPLSEPNVSDIYVNSADKFVRSKLADVEKWSLVSSYMERLFELNKRYFVHHGTAVGDALPGDVAIGLRQTYKHLESMLRELLEPLPGQVLFSPAVRAHIRLQTGEKAEGVKLCPNMPANVKRLTDILSGFHRDWSMGIMGPLDRVELLLDELDHFYNDGRARKTISSFIAVKISDMSLVAEILRQLEFFLPNSLECLEGNIEFNLSGLMASSIADKEARAVLTKLETPFSSLTAKRMVGSMLCVSYPVEKRRTKETVQALQKAELALDGLWKAITGDAKQRYALSTRCQQILNREPYRTPQWVEPPRLELPVANSTSLDDGLQALHLDDGQAQEFVSQPTRKTKPKTRGKLPSGATTEAIVQPAAEPTVTKSKARVIKVDAKSFEVFKTLFFVSSSASQPGEVAWVHFLHAMRNVGFALEKLGGSAWRFTPAQPLSTDDDPWRVICFHEPHPSSKLPFWMARRNGRRLQKAYGWDAETFSLK